MRALMDAPRLAKIYAISATADPAPVLPDGPQEMASIVRRIEAAAFTGRGDRKIVLDMYRRFQLDGAQAASRLACSSANVGTAARQELSIENAVQRQRAARLPSASARPMSAGERSRPTSAK